MTEEELKELWNAILALLVRLVELDDSQWLDRLFLCLEEALDAIEEHLGYEYDGELEEKK